MNCIVLEAFSLPAQVFGHPAEHLQPIACQLPLSIGFSRWEYWSGLPFPASGDLLHLGVKPGFPTLQADTLLSEPPANLCESESRSVVSDSLRPHGLVHGVLQARILEWVVSPFSRESSQPRDQTQVSRTTAESLPAEPYNCVRHSKCRNVDTALCSSKQRQPRWCESSWEEAQGPLKVGGKGYPLGVCSRDFCSTPQL